MTTETVSVNEDPADDANPSLLPENIKEMLYSTGTGTTWHLPGSDEAACEGAKFHSPNPLFTEWVPLVRPWWKNGQSMTIPPGHPRANLCGTCRDNLNILLQMLYVTNGDLAWPVRREFGNALRALACKGWDWYVENRPADDERA